MNSLSRLRPHTQPLGTQTPSTVLKAQTFSKIENRHKQNVFLFIPLPILYHHIIIITIITIHNPNTGLSPILLLETFPPHP